MKKKEKAICIYLGIEIQLYLCYHYNVKNKNNKSREESIVFYGFFCSLNKLLILAAIFLPINGFYIEIF